MSRFLAFVLMVTATAVLAGTAMATGVLIPKDESIPPLAIKYQRVSSDIKEGVANTHIEQAFTNSTSSQLEATYVFPLPKGASIKEFALYINGKRTKAELVEAGKAKQVYEDIVRRMKDPALLEYMDGQLFKMRVFPVPAKGDQKIELDFSQVIDYDNGLMKYVYPLRVGDKYSKTLEDFSMTVNLTSNVPIKNIYSPSHKVSTDFKGEKQAVVGFEEDQSALDRDFTLYWSFSEEDFGLNSISQREKGTDGFFALMIAPKRDFDQSMIINKDIVFVLDTSGSMSGDNIEQAKKALEFCVNSLNKADRFNIVQFATEVNPYEPKLIDASPENIQKAKEYIGKIEALGATDIDGALKKALEMKTDDARPFMVIFITDGKPTIGVKDPKSILANVEKQNSANTRIFVFGVGYRINTDLLDGIALSTKGVSEYVEPNEEIDHKITSFYAKASHPVLANVKLEFGEGLKVYDMYPKEIPDLFKGQQILAFGRYNGYGDYSVTLTGEVNGETKKYVYETSFPEEKKDNEFVERLWAVRRVGYLIEEIRQNGDEKEIVDEIIHLGKQYGIVTPYTSYLIVEDEKHLETPDVTHGVTPGIRRIAGGDLPHSAGESKEAVYRYLYLGDAVNGKVATESEGKGGKEKGDSEIVTGAIPVFDDGDVDADEVEISVESLDDITLWHDAKKEEKSYTKYAADGYSIVDSSEGVTGVRMSKKTREMKDSAYEYDTSGRHLTKNIDKRNFYKIGDAWVDSAYKKTMTRIPVKYGSKAYFKLLELKPELKDFLALGANLVLSISETEVLVISDNEDLKDAVDADKIEELLKE